MPMPPIRTYYEILGVPHDADEATLRRSYRRAMQTVHPDRNPDGKRTARRTRHLNAAKETLLDAEKRKRYDAKLRRRGLIPDFPQKTNPDFSAPPQSQNPSRDSPVNQENQGSQFAPESRRPPGGSTRGDFDYGKPLGRKQFRSGKRSRKPGFGKAYQRTRTPAQFVNTKNIIAAFCVTACLILIALFPWKEIQKTIISWAQPEPSPLG
ncbi:J domain-containing protein, partial [Mariniblastus sp.]|nr:J domain-containing protein [Mariniblastus sp.]